jgi:hypothetical protein
MVETMKDNDENEVRFYFKQEIGNNINEIFSRKHQFRRQQRVVQSLQ